MKLRFQNREPGNFSSFVLFFFISSSFVSFRSVVNLIRIHPTLLCLSGEGKCLKEEYSYSLNNDFKIENRETFPVLFSVSSSRLRFLIFVFFSDVQRGREEGNPKGFMTFLSASLSVLSSDRTSCMSAPAGCCLIQVLPGLMTFLSVSLDTLSSGRTSLASCTSPPAWCPKVENKRTKVENKSTKVENKSLRWKIKALRWKIKAPKVENKSRKSQGGK